MRKIRREEIERAARLYKSNKDASLALGITLQAFGRICRRYDVETPFERKCTRRPKPNLILQPPAAILMPATES